MTFRPHRSVSGSRFSYPRVACSVKLIDRHYPRRPSQPLHDASILARRSRLLSFQSCTLDHSLESLPSEPAHTSQGSARQSTACSPTLLARHTSASATLRARGESVRYASRGWALGCPCYPLGRRFPPLHVHHRPPNLPPH